MGRIFNRDTKRLQIVQAAAAVFARHGYEATLMDEVAEAAGVSKGSLYDYFENKEDLFYAVFEWCLQQVMLASMAQLPAGSSMRDQIVNFAETAVTASVEQIALYPVTLEVWAAAAKTGTRKRFAKAMQALYAEYRRTVEAMLHAAQAGGEIKADADIPVLAAMLVGAVDGLLLQYWLDPSFDPKIWVRTFLGALFDGIAAKPTEVPCPAPV